MSNFNIVQNENSKMPIFEPTKLKSNPKIKSFTSMKDSRIKLSLNIVFSNSSS